MEKKEIKLLLEQYFEGITTEKEETALQDYFHSGNVDPDFAEYTGYFAGLGYLSGNMINDSSIESDVMDYILENEGREKRKYRWLWKTVTGIAASVIIVLGGFLFYENQKPPFKDSFNDPEKAYAYAEQTMRYVSVKYNRGVEELAYFGKLQKAAEPLNNATEPVNRVIEKFNNLNK